MTAAESRSSIVQFLATDDHKFFKAFVQSQLAESVLQKQVNKILKIEKVVHVKLAGAFAPKLNYVFKPERLSDNGTLDTFLYRVRLEMLNTDQYKQIKHDNLARKERLVLRELINNPHILINKEDKGSTIVVEDRDEYIKNAMLHLHDTTFVKISPPTLK